MTVYRKMSRVRSSEVPLNAAIYYRSIGQADRDAAAKKGDALPDGSYPIRNKHELNSALILAKSGHGSHPVSVIRAHIRKQAVKLGATKALSDPFLASRADGDAPVPMLSEEPTGFGQNATDLHSAAVQATRQGDWANAAILHQQAADAIAAGAEAQVGKQLAVDAHEAAARSAAALVS
jgi:hypothetical protein